MSEIYIGVDDVHWIYDVEDDGRIVILEDSSRWEVSILDRVHVMLWLPTANITVKDGDDPIYPYLLINTDENETANAKLLSQ